MTELVFTKNNQILTTSTLVAQEFKKSHKHVLEKIDSLVKNLTAQNSAVKKYFIEDKFVNDRNREYRHYLLTRDGFSLLVMGFTGKKALKFKTAFIDAFNEMQNILLKHHNATWIEARDSGKIARREETDKIKQFIEYATNQGSTKAKFYYAHFTNATYKALEILGKNKATPIRDILDEVGLGYLMIAEHVVIDALNEGMAEKKHYKEIYVFAKQKLEEFARVLPKRKLLKY